MPRFWKGLAIFAVVGIFWGQLSAQNQRPPLPPVGTYQFFITGNHNDSPHDVNAGAHDPPYADICRGNTVTGEIQFLSRDARGARFQWDTLLVMPQPGRR